jgi:hypothetical protein
LICQSFRKEYKLKEGRRDYLLKNHQVMINDKDEFSDESKILLIAFLIGGEN